MVISHGFFYTISINRLHNLKSVVRAVKLSVVVKRGMYLVIANNYRIIEHSGPSTDRKCMKFQRRIQMYT